MNDDIVKKLSDELFCLTPGGRQYRVVEEAMAEITCLRAKANHRLREAARAAPERAVEVPDLGVDFFRMTPREVHEALTAEPVSAIVPSTGAVTAIHAEIASVQITRPENAGRLLAELNDGRLLYLNHANEWHECPNFIADQRSELAKAQAVNRAFEGGLKDTPPMAASAPAHLPDPAAGEVVACSACGCEERGQGGYLQCECPAPRPRSARALRQAIVEAIIVLSAKMQIRLRQRRGMLVRSNLEPSRLDALRQKHAAVMEQRKVLLTEWYSTRPGATVLEASYALNLSLYVASRVVHQLRREWRARDRG